MSREAEASAVRSVESPVSEGRYTKAMEAHSDLKPDTPRGLVWFLVKPILYRFGVSHFAYPRFG